VEVYTASDSAQAARKALSDGFRTLVAAGGDGTIAGVASVVIDSDATLGVLPVGTLNHFAKALQIPLDFEQAVEVITAGRTETVDVGEVNGRIFLNNSSLGLYPTMVVLRRNHEGLGLSRGLALLWASLKSLLRLPTIDVRLTTDGTHIERKTPLLFVGNNEYEVGRLRAGVRNNLCGKELFVCVTAAVSRMELIGMSLRALFGRLQNVEGFETFSTTEAIVEGCRAMVRVSLDGEVVLLTMPLHYRIRPASLRVLVP
jgi:diacylglycerol kinase family enzyme